MSISQKRGVITPMPKQDSDLTDLSNWRPITLLNIDYKIASKVIAKRIEKVLTHLINPDQTGFVKVRYIGQNVRLINDILEQKKLQNKSGIFLQLDFRKAFDTIEWNFIQKTISFFNFGDYIERWAFHVLYQLCNRSFKQRLLYQLFSVIKRGATGLSLVPLLIHSRG